jgi:aspartate aminotransferase
MLISEDYPVISEKMLRLAQNNSVIRAMFEEGNALAAKFGRENVFDFSLGNPNFPAPPSLDSAVRAVLDDTPPTDVHGYMSNAGFLPVRRAVSENLNNRFGTDYAPEGIIMSVGAAGALNVVLKTLLNPGDEVLAFAPYFVEYGNYVANYDGVLNVVPPNPPSFLPDAAAFSAKITEKTKAVIINTPNNPTGVIYGADTLSAIAEVLDKKQKEYDHPIYLISDEPYRELVYDGAVQPFAAKFYANTIVCYSWSKSLSLPGERIGYIAVRQEAEDYALLLEAMGIATRVMGFVNAPALMQLAVARVLDEQPAIEGYVQNRKLLYEGLSALGYESVRPDGAFYLWVKAPGGDDKAFVAAAKKHNILFVPGTSFACPGYVRIAYCVSGDMIQRSMAAFAALADELGLRKA